MYGIPADSPVAAQFDDKVEILTACLAAASVPWRDMRFQGGDGDDDNKI